MLNIPAIVTVLFLLAVVGIILNGLCIYIILTSVSLRKRASSLLVLNLLAVHLGQSLLVFPFYAMKKLDLDVLKKFIANGWRISYMISFYATVLCILFISIDRFLATYWLAYYKTRMTKPRVKIALLALWIYVVCLCSIPLSNQVKYEKRSTDGNGTVTSIWVDSKYVYNPQEEWVVFMLSFNTIIPYCIILACYMYIIYKLQSMDVMRRRYVASSNAKRPTLQERVKKGSIFKQKDLKKYQQVTRLTLILSLLYGVLWSPSVIYYILVETCTTCFAEHWEDSPTEQVVGFIIKYLAFMDAVASPLVYCFFHAEFRKGLQRIKSSLLRRELPVDIISHSSNETTAMV